MANGRVCTGFSMPWVALYSESSGTITYSGGMPLARGVNVSLSVESGGDNDFYADNVLAESDTQSFSGGTMTLVVDGLKDAARKLITGLTTTKGIAVSGATVTFEVYDDLAVVPYVGVGFIARYMEAGVTSYVPIIITKCKFSDPEINAATQEDTIDWQTQSLEATIMRDDSTNHAWKMIGEAQTTEAAAYNAIKAILLASA